MCTRVCVYVAVYTYMCACVYIYIYIAKGSVHICQHGICIRTLATSQTLVGSSRELRGSLNAHNY